MKCNKLPNIVRMAKLVGRPGSRENAAIKYLKQKRQYAQLNAGIAYLRQKQRYETAANTNNTSKNFDALEKTCKKGAGFSKTAQKDGDP